MKLHAALPFLVALNWAHAQEAFPLWPDGAPGALGKSSNDIPTLTAYLPNEAKASGAAIVVCPGGGYGGLAPHEGKDYALYLNHHGVAAFVLKYRLGPHGYRHRPCCRMRNAPSARCAPAPANGASI
jgi:acetyl esterase/lipase